MSSKLKKLIPSVAFFFPFVIFAQDLETIGDRIVSLLNLVVPIVMTFALIYFFVGLVKYIMAAGDDEAKGAGRSIMINGVIALFVMAAVWGLVNVLIETFGIDAGGPPVDSGILIPR